MLRRPDCTEYVMQRRGVVLAPLLLLTEEKALVAPAAGLKSS